MTCLSDPRPLVEQAVTLSLPSTRWVFYGSIDDMPTAAGGNGIEIVDYKVTADPAALVDRKAIDFQPDLYTLAAQEAGYQVAGIQYRILANPTIRIKKDEAPEEYEERVVEWLQADGKLMEYGYTVNPRRLRSAKVALLDTVDDIERLRITDKWRYNTHACKSFNSTCPFIELCRAKAEDLDVEAIIESDFEPRERRTEGADIPEGLDVISYSSMSTFNECEMRYFWKYERSIQKIRESDSEALRVGKLLHRGREFAALEGLDAGLQQIDKDAADYVTLGDDDQKKKDTITRKARALLRASVVRWPLTTGSQEPEPKDDPVKQINRDIMSMVEEFTNLCRRKAEQHAGTVYETWIEYYSKRKTAKGEWSTRNVNDYIIGTKDPKKLERAKAALHDALAKARKEAKA